MRKSPQSSRATPSPAGPLSRRRTGRSRFPRSPARPWQADGGACSGTSVRKGRAGLRDEIARREIPCPRESASLRLAPEALAQQALAVAREVLGRLDALVARENVGAELPWRGFLGAGFQQAIERLLHRLAPGDFVRDAVFCKFLFDAWRQADGDGHGGMYDKVFRIVLQPTARRKCAGFHPPRAASLAAGTVARSSPRLRKRMVCSRQAQASVAA